MEIRFSCPIQYPNQVRLCSFLVQIRLRGQVTLLRKAVLEEREKNKELQNALVEKTNEVYKCLAQQDKLEMSNTACKARLEKLTKEAEEAQDQVFLNAGSGAWGSILVGGVQGPTQQQLANFLQKHKTLKKELLSKTDENENLHIQINELKSAHRNTMQTFERKVVELNLQLSRGNEVIQAIESEWKKVEKELKKEIEKKDLQIASLKMEFKMQESKLLAESIQVKHDYDMVLSALINLQSRLELSNPFSIFKYPSLLAFNLPKNCSTSEHFIQV